jgi:hypothetical protein
VKRLLIVAAALVAVPSALSKGGMEQVFAVRPAGERGPLVAYDSRTGDRMYALPPGMASAGGERYFTAVRRKAGSTLVAYSLSNGRIARAWGVAGRWRLGGVSPTGRWLALESRPGRGRTTIGVFDTWVARLVHLLRLRGSFEVETISRDGKRLFLVQHLYALGPGRYRIRLYDLSRERLVANPLRAKGEDEVMAGLAWAGIGSRDGRWLLTLYLDTARSSAFIHALDLNRSRPVCIDLPSAGGKLAALERYTLTLTLGARTALAANPALGVVAEVDLARSRVVRRAVFRPGPGRGASRSALSPDGRTLSFSGGDRLWTYDRWSGRVRGPYRLRHEVTGLGFSPDGRRLLVARRTGRVLLLDPATGSAATLPR